MTPDELWHRLDRLDRMSRTLDTRFRMPVLGIPVGWDSIVGLIPGLGDAITLGPGAWTIVESARMGARKRALARMAWNTGVDVVIGGIPLLGDAFDLVFKSHRRNVALLRREIERLTAEQDGGATRQDTEHAGAMPPREETPTRMSDARRRLPWQTQ